jgi:hypothetical protein
VSAGEAYCQCSGSEDSNGSTEQVEFSEIFGEGAVDEDNEPTGSAAYDLNAGRLTFDFECWPGRWFGNGGEYSGIGGGVLSATSIGVPDDIVELGCGRPGRCRTLRVTGRARIFRRRRIVQQGRRDLGWCGKGWSGGILAARRFAETKSMRGMKIEERRGSVRSAWRAKADCEVFSCVNGLSDGTVVEIAVGAPIDERGKEQEGECEDRAVPKLQSEAEGFSHGGCTPVRGEW